MTFDYPCNLITDICNVYTCACYICWITWQVLSIYRCINVYFFKKLLVWRNIKKFFRFYLNAAFLCLHDERADIHIKSLCHLYKSFEAWLRTVGTPLAHGGWVFTQFVCQPLGCPFVFNQYYLDAIDIFLCHILSCVSWSTKVKIILDNQERLRK